MDDLGFDHPLSMRFSRYVRDADGRIGVQRRDREGRQAFEVSFLTLSLSLPASAPQWA